MVIVIVIGSVPIGCDVEQTIVMVLDLILRTIAVFQVSFGECYDQWRPAREARGGAWPSGVDSRGRNKCSAATQMTENVQLISIDNSIE